MSHRIRSEIWATFAGLCAICRKSLIHTLEGSRSSLLGEVCHIVGRKTGAARHDPSCSKDKLDHPDNLILLCREHHKLIDDNDKDYTVEKLHEIRKGFLVWLNSRLEQEQSCSLAISEFLYLNMPRLAEIAMLHGYRIPFKELPADQPLTHLGFELNALMTACHATLNSLDIRTIPIEQIGLPQESYVGSLISFDNLRFRTKNIHSCAPPSAAPTRFTGELSADPHIYRNFGTWKLILNIDPRWITTSTAHVMFRPTGGHSLFAGVARLRSVNLDSGQVVGTPLALGLPLPTFDFFSSSEAPASEIEFAKLEDEVTKSHGSRWHGEIDYCDVCGKSFASELYMIDGPMTPNGMWGNLCASCYSKSKLPLGVGKGQLYRRESGFWKLVGGYPERKDSD